jgi:hypothetical protein
MEYAEMLLDPLLPAYANLPAGSTATEKGPKPAANGDPAIPPKAPLAGFIANAEILLELKFAT